MAAGIAPDLAPSLPVQGEQARWTSRSFVLPVLAAFFLIRLALIGFAGLGDDEPYYWTWSRTLEWSYFEHPGMVAWPIHFFCAVLGNTVFAVRLPTLLWSVATLWVVFKLVREIFPADEGLAWGTVLLLNVVPLMSIGAVFVAPDAPFAFFWCLALLFARRALTRSPAWWYAAGLAGGLGLISKYNMVLFPPTIFAYLYFSGRVKETLSKKEPWIAGLLMTAFFTPVLIWNADHHWASFAFHLVGRHAGKSGHWYTPAEHLGQFLLAMVALVSPFLLIGAVLGLSWAAKRKDERWTFVVASSLVVVAFFAVLCPFGDFKPHWPAVGYVTAMIAAAGWLRDDPTLRKWSINFATGMTLVMYSLAFIPLGAWVEDLTDLVHPAWTAAVVKADLTSDLYGWPEAAAKAREIGAHLEHPFYFAHMYQNASQLSFAAPDLEVTRLGDRHDEFEIRRDDAELRGRDAVFVSRNNFFQDPNGHYPFAGCDPQPSVLPFERGGRVVRTYSFWVCRNYQP